LSHGNRGTAAGFSPLPPTVWLISVFQEPIATDFASRAADIATSHTASDNQKIQLWCDRFASGRPRARLLSRNGDEMNHGGGNDRRYHNNLSLSSVTPNNRRNSSAAARFPVAAGPGITNGGRNSSAAASLPGDRVNLHPSKYFR